LNFRHLVPDRSRELVDEGREAFRPGMGRFDADTMVALMQRVIERAASHENCVIVGRGAPYFLRNRQDAFHFG
jgi:hypothetical protein